MMPWDKTYIDALLWREGMGLTNWVDQAQLENYRLVYPEYFTDLPKDAAAPGVLTPRQGQFKGAA
jgi:hypothetical protein